MNGSKNIFAIISYPFLPATTGGEISTLQILNYMGKVNQVTVFTVEPYKDVSHQKFDFELIFGMPFKATRYINIFLLPKIIKLIKQHQSDAVFFDQPWFGWMIPFIRLFTGKKVFIRSNNIEYLRFKSMDKQWWPLMYMYEKFTYKVSNLVIFVSEAEQQKAIYEFDLNPEHTLHTPYGIPQLQKPELSANARQKLGELHSILPGEKIILFFATMSYRPNYEAVEFIISQIYPKLKETATSPFKILICGKNLPANIIEKLKDKPEIIYAGFVAEIELYIDGADVMINPILSGGGVKTKAIDTLGRSQVVISTRTGAEGIDPAVCGSNLIICENNNWSAFVKAINNQLHLNRPVIPQSFYDTYSWPHIIENLMQKLEKY
ncbi:MAG: glycosyltransferase family 4 protein [Bacteroidia bacterium]|nr:glycosyltransferase family 4 protein [Bacteroidia bacterium]